MSETPSRPPFVAKLRPLRPDRGDRVTITVCTNMRPPTKIAPSCGTTGSQAIADQLPGALRDRGIAAEVVTIACLGMCQKGPNLRISPCGSWVHEIDPGHVDALADRLAAHLAGAPPPDDAP
jgi:(2Fe-2S) ferredoxin